MLSRHLSCTIKPFVVISAHRAVVFGSRRAGMRGTRGAVVGAEMVGVVEHVHHGHAEVHSQRVDHKEAKAGEQRQAVARGTAYWGCRGKHRQI